MKILITGANGQLGRCLQDALTDSEHQLLCTTRVSMDVTCPDDIERVFKQFQPTLVINAAAFTAVDKAEERKELAFLVNQKACEYLAKSSKKHNAALIHVSTDYVFDGQATKPYTEISHTNPQGVYGKSKLAGENEITKHAEQYCILRTSWVFSEYGNNFVKTMLHLAKNRDELSIVDDQIGCPTYAGDIAQTIILIGEQMLNKNHQNGVYNFCGKPECTWYKFATEIFSIAMRLGVIEKDMKLKPITTDEYPTLAKRPGYSVLDTKKYNVTFEIKTPDWKNSLEKAILKLA